MPEEHLLILKSVKVLDDGVGVVSFISFVIEPIGEGEEEEVKENEEGKGEDGRS
jgi:hypothetical protein